MDAAADTGRRTVADELIDRGPRRPGRDRGEAVTPRDLWVAIATEYVFRLPTVRFADAHAGAAEPGVGTYGYLFTWESPAFGGVLGSCHALEIPFVFGTVHNPAVQAFSGGGDDAFALSAVMRGAWTAFARTGSPVATGGLAAWPTWDARGGRPRCSVRGPDSGWTASQCRPAAGRGAGGHGQGGCAADRHVKADGGRRDPGLRAWSISVCMTALPVRGPSSMTYAAADGDVAQSAEAGRLNRLQ